MAGLARSVASLQRKLSLDSDRDAPLTHLKMTLSPDGCEHDSTDFTGSLEALYTARSLPGPFHPLFAAKRALFTFSSELPASAVDDAVADSAGPTRKGRGGKHGSSASLAGKRGSRLQRQSSEPINIKQTQEDRARLSAQHAASTALSGDVSMQAASASVSSLTNDQAPAAVQRTDTGCSLDDDLAVRCAEDSRRFREWHDVVFCSSW